MLRGSAERARRMEKTKQEEDHASSVPQSTSGTRKRHRRRGSRVISMVLALVALILLRWLRWPKFEELPCYLSSPTPSEECMDKKVRRILRHNPLIDGHIDFAFLVRFMFNNHIYNETFTKPFEQGGMPGEVDIPRLEQGLMGGALWSMFVPCPTNISDFSNENYAESVRATFSQIDVHHRLRMQYSRIFPPSPDPITALSSFHKQHNLISPLSLEGLHQIGNRPSHLRAMHNLGVRAASLTWNCHNIYADAALHSYLPERRTVPAPPLHHGVSVRGRRIIYEMNRLGILVDLAHASRETMIDVLVGSERWGGWKGSVAPPIFSHSSAYAICPHPRNVDDEVLWMVRKRRGLVMINFTGEFIACTAVDEAGEPKLPRPVPEEMTLDQVVRHIRYVGELIGYDYVGIGSDYGVIAGPPKGLEDVGKFPALVKTLLRQGVGERDVKKLLGGNLLRVWREAEGVKELMELTVKPLEDELDPLFEEDKMEESRYKTAS